jgi:hypothetical protein
MGACSLLRGQNARPLGPPSLIGSLEVSPFFGIRFQPATNALATSSIYAKYRVRYCKIVSTPWATKRPDMEIGDQNDSKKNDKCSKWQNRRHFCTICQEPSQNRCWQQAAERNYCNTIPESEPCKLFGIIRGGCRHGHAPLEAVVVVTVYRLTLNPHDLPKERPAVQVCPSLANCNEKTGRFKVTVSNGPNKSWALFALVINPPTPNPAVAP